jgi:adenylate cyclase
VIRTLPPDRQPDVLIMASRGSQADEKMVRNAGAAGIISKPFTMDTLLATTERALADRRASLEKAQLEKYMSKASMRMAIEKSILSGKMATARAFRRSATIFFSDVAGFTTRCEKYSPREVVTQINTLFEVMTRVIMESHGDIDKFIGDACMAFWLDEDPVASAERAVRTTLRLRRELARMNQERAALVDDPIRIRVGINTGEIILCDLGSPDARIDLTIIGDPVNVAARFETAAKQYGVDNLIGESSIKPLLDRFSARLIDWVRVKGKNEPVECYELVNEQEKTSAAEAQLIREFGQAMVEYRAGNFGAALALFERSQKLEGGPNGGLTPSRLYQERCRKLIEDPPRHWTGVWSLESK